MHRFLIFLFTAFTSGIAAAQSCAMNSATDQVTITINGGGGGGGGNGGDCGDPGNGPDCFPPPPAFCGAPPAGRMLPFDIVRNGQLNFPDGVAKRNYFEAFDPDAWPESGDSAGFLIPRNNYIALPFVADPAGAAWRMNYVDSPTSGQLVNVAISPCPGEFDPPEPNCVVTTGPFGAITAITGTSNLACELVPGGIYYLNVRNSTAGGSNACNRAVCEWLARPTRLQ